MERLKRFVRPIAPFFSARHRHWSDLLSSLDSDPIEAVGSMSEPGPDDFIICGCPRTGTSLLCGQLFQPPGIVTVMEPWDGMRMPVAELFDQLRSEIAEGTLGRGRLDVEALVSEGRVRWCGDGEKPVEVDVEEPFLLGVKWPAFWRYLDGLEETRFLVCVRDPVETIASFKKSGGRLAEGLSYDIAFNREMNEHLESGTRDVELRRVLMYEYINSRILEHIDRPNVLLVRYERWFDDAEGLHSDISEFLGVDIPPWRVEIRPSAASGEDLSYRERDLIRDHCPSATQLEYQTVDR